MSHLEAAVRLLEVSDEPGASSSDRIHALRQATAHAVLDVGESAENSVGQLERIADAIEALVRVLDPGPCGHIVGTQCVGCDHKAHTGRRCLTDVIGASGALAECGCRWDAEQVTRG